MAKNLQNVQEKYLSLKRWILYNLHKITYDIGDFVWLLLYQISLHVVSYICVHAFYHIWHSYIAFS